MSDGPVTKFIQQKDRIRTTKRTTHTGYTLQNKQTARITDIISNLIVACVLAVWRNLCLLSDHSKIAGWGEHD